MAGSGVDVWEQSVGMAKSGDDLMRWQSIARGERRCCRPRTYLCRSIERVGPLGIPACYKTREW